MRFEGVFRFHWFMFKLVIYNESLFNKSFILINYFELLLNKFFYKLNNLRKKVFKKSPKTSPKRILAIFLMYFWFSLSSLTLKVYHSVEKLSKVNKSWYKVSQPWGGFSSINFNIFPSFWWPQLIKIALLGIGYQYEQEIKDKF